MTSYNYDEVTTSKEYGKRLSKTKKKSKKKGK
jgi:hypothetical protein